MLNVYFSNFWPYFYEHIEEFTIVKALREIDDVVICKNAEDADYYFFSVMRRREDIDVRVPDRCVRIFYTGENIVPDFNICDYAIGFEWMQYEDRYLRMPYIYNSKRFERICDLCAKKHVLPIPEKKYFCSFTVSDSRADSKRLSIFHALQKYKPVNSGGKLENNIGGRIKDKLAFDRIHKFSLCAENSSHNGYCTEKLPQAFAAQTIPIYWGDPEVTKIYNSKAFINAHDYATIDELVERVKEVDNNPVLYASMLAEPALISPEEYSYEAQYEQLKSFLRHIVTQPLDRAHRIHPSQWSDEFLQYMRTNSHYGNELRFSFFFLLRRSIGDFLYRHLPNLYSILFENVMLRDRKKEQYVNYP